MPDLELTDAQIDEYLTVALANGFSKGTANVSPDDMKKLRPLLRHYAKKAHPFRACVRDNRKRFGPRTNAVCAVLKDLIKGTTKWRSSERKKNLSQDDDFLAFTATIPDEFYVWLSEVDEDEIALWMEDYSVSGMPGGIPKGSDVSGMPRRDGRGQAIRNAPPPEAEYRFAEDPARSCANCTHFEDGYCELYNAFVDAGYTSRGFEAAGRSPMGLSEGELALAEVFVEGGDVQEEDGLLWKTVLREGRWEYTPGPDGPKQKPMTIVREGKSNSEDLVVSMSELLDHFERGAVEHVTVPLSHEDRVDENTGFVRKLKMDKDGQGRWVLRAGLDFTEPDIREKALRGTIANTSGGILFDHVHKESGEKFGSVLGHVALTNRPWLNGMEPFGVSMGEDVRVLSFSQELAFDRDQGGDKMGDENKEQKDPTELETQLALAEQRNRELQEELDERRRKDRARAIAGSIERWEAEHKAPAVVALAQQFLTADKGEATLNLSENGKRQELNLSDIVERLVDASPSLDLADGGPSDEDRQGDRPKDDTNDDKEVQLSREERTLASQLFLSGDYSEEGAVTEAKRRLADGGTR